MKIENVASNMRRKNHHAWVMAMMNLIVITKDREVKFR